MKNRNVTLVMEDLFTGQEVIRTIDSINAMKSGSVCWELGTPESQRERLMGWIRERGNDQHNTELELKSWTFS